MFEKGVALAGDLQGVIISATEPDPEDRDKAWIKLSVAGGPPALSLPLVWFNGKWVARHPDDPSGDARRLWIGAEADLTTYDGGTAGVVSDVSGPMWEVDHDFDRRFPIGPDATAPAIAVGATGGAATHTLTQAELPSGLSVTVKSAEGTDFDPQADRFLAVPTAGASYPDVIVPLNAGTDTAFDIIPPYKAIFVIKRSARIFYTS